MVNAVPCRRRPLFAVQLAGSASIHVVRKSELAMMG